MPTTTATPAPVATEPDQPATAAVAVQSPPKVTTDGVLDLDAIVRQLVARTVDADNAAEVRQVVDDVAHEFDDARVRSFLPVLVLKEAQDRLRARGLIGRFAD